MSPKRILDKRAEFLAASRSGPAGLASQVVYLLILTAYYATAAVLRAGFHRPRPGVLVAVPHRAQSEKAPTRPAVLAQVSEKLPAIQPGSITSRMMRSNCNCCARCNPSILRRHRRRKLPPPVHSSGTWRS